MRTVASFFTGIGGIDLAFVWAGFDIVVQCEVDDFAQAILKKHKATYWPHARLFKDIRHVSKKQVGKVDVIVGGFPCQDISTAGKRAGIKRGTRSGLWYELARIIGEVRPKAVLLENVANITVLGGTTVIADLTRLGYDAQWLTLRASDVGASHRRERWFLVAHRNRNQRRMGLRPAYSSKKKVNRHKTQRREDRDRSAMGTTINTPRTTARRRQSGSKRRVLRTVYGLSKRVDRDTRQCHKVEVVEDIKPGALVQYDEGSLNNMRVKALGNAVVPQVVYPLALSIKQMLKESA